MSLSTGKTTAKAEVKKILEDMITREGSSTEEFAERLIEIMEAWLKQATIKYDKGLIAPNGAVTGIFNGQLE